MKNDDKLMAAKTSWWPARKAESGQVAQSPWLGRKVQKAGTTSQSHVLDSHNIRDSWTMWHCTTQAIAQKQKRTQKAVNGPQVGFAFDLRILVLTYLFLQASFYGSPRFFPILNGSNFMQKNVLWLVLFFFFM